MSNILNEVLSTALSGIKSLDSQIRTLASSASGSENIDSTTFLELQNLSSQYQMAVSTTSATMKNFADTMQGVIQKIS
jgi:hypothetical protein